MHGKALRRFWEVDAARGVAILMMVIYHLLYDLDTFGGYPIDSRSGFWAYFADATAAVFVFLAGLSLSISFSRDQKAGRSGWPQYRKQMRRGSEVFLCGMLITFAFWAFDLGGVVVFGILHLIGLSAVLAYPFKNLGSYNVAPGVLFIAVGAYIQRLA